MWNILESEQDVDGTHNHANGIDYTIPVRLQRDVTENTQTDANAGDNGVEIGAAGAKNMKQSHLSKIKKRQQLLQTIFTNFLHP